MKNIHSVFKNFKAKGHYTEGAELIDSVLDVRLILLSGQKGTPGL